MIGRQVLPVAALGTVLVGFPDPVPGGPGDADMMPLAIIDDKGQLGHLRRRMTHILWTQGHSTGSVITASH